MQFRINAKPTAEEFSKMMQTLSPKAQNIVKAEIKNGYYLTNTGHGVFTLYKPSMTDNTMSTTAFFDSNTAKWLKTKYIGAHIDGNCEDVSIAMGLKKGDFVKRTVERFELMPLKDSDKKIFGNYDPEIWANGSKRVETYRVADQEGLLHRRTTEIFGDKFVETSRFDNYRRS